MSHDRSPGGRWPADIYDRAVPPAGAVELLDDVLSRIVLGLRVPVIAIAGNHDSPERLSFGSRGRPIGRGGGGLAPIG